MNKFYFSEETEDFTVKNKKGRIQIKTFKSIIDFMNSYHYFRGQGKSIEETYPNKINIDKGDKVVPSRVLHLQKDDVYLIIPDYLVLGEGEKK